MEKNEIRRYVVSMTGGILLICLGLLFPLINDSSWFGIVMKVRESINAGDSGHLILAASSMSFLYTVQSVFIFLGTMLVIYNLDIRPMLGKLEMYMVSLFATVSLHWLDSVLLDVPWEPVSTILALVITLFLFEKIFGETNSFLQVAIVSIQVFYAFQWLNIMPLFSPYLIGQSDIPNSIKIAGVYLQAVSVMNFTGFAFFLPFISSAFITATLFISFSQNMHIMRENYEKEGEIRDIKAKALENRIYMEVKSLVHDLKTPLVTIRGLNSLLSIAKEQGKLEEYSERIENSITKMNEMISSFLYESSRQALRPSELISYIRAQLPLEDDTIRIDIDIEEALPDIYVNKIRIARAVINVMENAILAPYREPYKHIMFTVRSAHNGLNIIIRDNGIGIKEANLPRIWEVGFSTNNTSGLGLPFAKQIIEDNDGRIELTSQEGKGTEVAIFLPSPEGFAAHMADKEK